MLTARDVMQTRPRSVAPETTLTELQRTLLAERIGGLPVVDGDRLVGIVSRSDVVRRLSVEQSVAEQVSEALGEGGDAAFLDRVGQQLGRRMEGLRVADVMSRPAVSVAPDAPLAAVARSLVEHGIHRLPVVEGDRLVGLISSVDLVRLIADGRLSEA